MATKTSTNLTAFDAFLNAREKAIPEQDQESNVSANKVESIKKSAQSPIPKPNRTTLVKTKAETAKPIEKINVVAEKGIETTEKKEEEPQPQIQRIGFSTILRPDLIRKLKMKALNDDIDIYEAVEKAIELFINS